MSIGRNAIASEPIAAATVDTGVRKPPRRRVTIAFSDAVLVPEPR